MKTLVEPRRPDEHQAGVNVGRRNLLKLTGVGVAALSVMSVDAPAYAQSTLAWDKTFPKRERVDHRRVSFYNRLGLTLVADLYIPETIDRSRRHAALVVGGPYGAVMEQAPGLYAHTMAERGFITIAHDPSYVGESGGQQVNWISPRPVLFITGDRAHSRIFSEHAHKRASEATELFIVPGAGHVDLHDRVNLMPWDKLTSFFARSLALKES